jgi:hypothetical protein
VKLPYTQLMDNLQPIGWRLRGEDASKVKGAISGLDSRRRNRNDIYMRPTHENCAMFHPRLSISVGGFPKLALSPLGVQSPLPFDTLKLASGSLHQPVQIIIFAPLKVVSW